LFFALSSNAYSQTLFALDIQVNKTPEGLFHIHLNPTGGGVDDGCYTQLELQFDFLQVTPNVTDPCSPTIINNIYSTALKDNQGQDIKFFGSNEALLSEYFPMNGVFDYVISLPTCSLTAAQIANINMVRITSNLYNGDCQPAQLNAMTPLYTLTFNFIPTSPIYYIGDIDNPTVCQTNVPVGHLQTGAPEVVTYVPTTMPYVPDLHLLQLGDGPVVSTNNTCATKNSSMGYVVPYGGCPPYTQIWEQSGLAQDNYDVDLVVPILNGYLNFWGFHLNQTYANLDGLTTGTNADRFIFDLHEVSLLTNTDISVTDNSSPTQNVSVTTTGFYTLAGTAIIPIGSPQTQFDLTGTHIISSTITVPNGATLTIHDAILGFSSNTGIVVEKGGKLLIQNSVLRAQNFSCFNVLGESSQIITEYKEWIGIRVKGTPTASQGTFTNIASYNNPSCGVVHITQNSKIQDARIAIANTLDNPIIEDGGTYYNFNFDPTTAGGLIIAEQTTFENNRIGIYFDKYTPNNQSQINGNTFTSKRDVYEGQSNLVAITNKIVAGIVSQRNTFANKLTGNTFECNFYYNPTTIEKRGIGILNYNSKMNIGQGDFAANNFNRLYKGIDYYCKPTITAPIKIVNNVFNGTHQNITLSGGTLAEIRYNNIINIPSTNSLLTYGVFVDATIGYTLNNNTISSYNPNTYGLIVRNTGGYAAEVTENQFLGNLKIGNIYVGKNTDLKIDCNQYTSDTDWWVVGVNEFSDGYLNDQGICDGGDITKARRNQFHPNDPSTTTDYHIANANTLAVVYRSQPNFLPTLNIGNVIVNDCGQTGTDQCTDFLNLAYINPTELANTLAGITNPQEQLLQYTKLLYARAYQNQTEQAKTDLNTDARDASYKLLTATYTDEGDTINALDALNKISLADPDNLDFYNLFTQLLSNGSGKTGTQLELRKIAQQNDRAIQALAQVEVAANTFMVFDKQLPANLLAQSTLNPTTLLHLYPNPSSGLVQISLNQIPSNGYLQLFDMQGRLLHSTQITQSTTTISTATYPNGIYYCQLLDNGHITATQKLVIIK
jgi:hypothetical protein